MPTIEQHVRQVQDRLLDLLRSGEQEWHFIFSDDGNDVALAFDQVLAILTKDMNERFDEASGLSIGGFTLPPYDKHN